MRPYMPTASPRQRVPAAGLDLHAQRDRAGENLGATACSPAAADLTAGSPQLLRQSPRLGGWLLGPRHSAMLPTTPVLLPPLRLARTGRSSSGPAQCEDLPHELWRALARPQTNDASAGPARPYAALPAGPARRPGPIQSVGSPPGPRSDEPPVTAWWPRRPHVQGAFGSAQRARTLSLRRHPGSFQDRPATAQRGGIVSQPGWHGRAPAWPWDVRMHAEESRSAQLRTPDESCRQSTHRR